MIDLVTRRAAAQKSAPTMGWLDVLIAFASYLAIQFAVGIALGIALVAMGNTSVEMATLLKSDTFVTVLLITGVVSAVFGVLLVALRRRAGFGLFGLVRVSWRWLLVGIGVGLLSLLIDFTVVPLYVWVTGDNSNPQQGMMDVAGGGSVAQFAFLMLLGGILIPFSEELLFRGVLYAWLRRWSVVFAVPASAVVFGLFHGLNTAMPFAMVLGMLLALLYEKSGSLWPSVVAHSVTNMLAFSLTRVFF